MPRIVLKKPVKPEELELGNDHNMTEVVSFGDIVQVVDRRSALRGFEVLSDIYNIFNEYPELIGELFVIEE